MARASAAYDAGRLAEAQTVLLPLARTHPNDREIQTLAGTVLAEGGAVSEALPYLEHARSLGAPSSTLLTNLGVAYLRLSRPSEATAALAAATRLSPRNVPATFALGQALMAEKLYARAATAFARVGELDPAGAQIPVADLRYDRALALWSDGRGDQAGEILRASPDVDTAAATQALLGEIEEHAGHYEAAVQHLERAAKLEASEPNVYAYALELLRHWTFAPAAEVFRYGTRAFPDSARMRLGLGTALFGSSDYKAAIPLFRAMLEADPESQTAADLLGRSCSALGAGDEVGCETLAEFARRHPANATASLYAATVILHRQDTTGAEALLRSALAVSPNLPEAWYDLGLLQQTNGAWAESAASLTRATELRPSYAEAHYRLARAFSHLGKREEAQHEIALQQQFVEQEKQANNQRLHEVVTFITAAR